MDDQEPRAKDVLSRMKPRVSLAERMLERMSGWTFQRPNVATSARLYDYFDVPDPYAPKERKDKWAVKMGPTALRLGENRRQPAPHMTVKDPKQKKAQPAPQQFRPQGIPQAKTRAEAPKPPPPPIPKQSQTGREFGQRGPRKLVGKLPVRPDMADEIAAQRRDGSSKPTNAPATAVSVPKTKRRAPLTAEEMAARRPPVPQQSAGEQSKRFRMRRTKVDTSTPIVRTVEKPVVSEPVAEKSPDTPVDRSVPKAPSSFGLDDLFGFGNQDEGRMRLPKRDKKK